MLIFQKQLERIVSSRVHGDSREWFYSMLHISRKGETLLERQTRLCNYKTLSFLIACRYVCMYVYLGIDQHCEIVEPTFRYSILRNEKSSWLFLTLCSYFISRETAKHDTTLTFRNRETAGNLVFLFSLILFLICHFVPCEYEQTYRSVSSPTSIPING